MLLCPKCRGVDIAVGELPDTVIWPDTTVKCRSCRHRGSYCGFSVPDDYLRLWALAGTLARMKYDGEESAEPGGDDYVMENDDAVSTLSETIRIARDIVSEAAPPEHIDKPPLQGVRNGENLD
jgi:hypothetical protein